MKLSVKLLGVDQAEATLKRKGRRIDGVLRGALNSTATKARAERYVKPLSSTLAPKRTRSVMYIKRARKGLMNSRVIPSSRAIPVVHYKTWGYDAIDKTRARIWVRGPSGRKIAAGFVNPSSKNKLPLSSYIVRSNKKGGTMRISKDLSLANGMSVAYWFKQLSGKDTVLWVSNYLQAEFNKRMQKELDKA